MTVAVIGGGPAGLAAATTLARAGRSVVLHEAGTYPRHRVCGEFLSPDAAPSLAEIGADGLPERLGAPILAAVRVTSSRGGRALAEASFPLTAPGWGVARHDLDAALAEHARREGVDVRTGARDAPPPGAAAVVVATGRGVRAGDDARAADARDWVGVKVHVRGVALPAVTELHCVDGAYVGLNEVACGGERVVNVCALVRAAAWDRAGRSPAGAWELLARESPAFAERWRNAAPVDGSDAAVAGFGFRPRGPRAGGALAVGDAAALTAPLSGAGQSAALASGVAAARLLLDRGDGARDAWPREFRAGFRRRLAVGGLLQSALLAPSAARVVLRIAAAAGPAAAWAYRSTRGAW